VTTGEASPQASFGLLLRRHRRSSGLSQEELADRAGVGIRTLSDLERGRTARPYRQTVGALATALSLRDTQLDEFLRLSRQGWPPAGQGPEDPALRAAPELAGQPGPVTIPRQLPAAVSHFTGRAAELDALTTLLDRPGEASTVVISALAGTAGVGKTATAVHWAHQVASRFPDGQLYVNLRGYDPAEPVTAADALAGFLRTLGVRAPEIPDSTAERAGLYRSKLAGRRVLVLLDNARDGEQVRPLLPGDPGCVAIVTSRDALAGLVAADGAVRLDLNVLPLAEATGLLRSLLGPRADDDPAATAELAGLCARLPLALRIAAELAAARPAAPLGALVAEFRDSGLDRLDAGEERADVRAVFSWSLRQLPEEAAAAFALIGLHPGADLDGYATAALTGSTPGQARRVLSRLHSASLIQSTGPGRYGLHDLLRAYAREQAAAFDTGGQRDQALTRLAGYYLAATAAAMDVLHPSEAYRRPRISAAGAVVPDMPSEAAAQGWLNRELENLVAITATSAARDWCRYLTDLARTLFRYLMTGSHLPEAVTIYGHALRAARQAGDLAAEASALNGLGGIGIKKGRFRDAAGYYHAALERYRRCGDLAGQAGALRNLGVSEHQLHDDQSAAGYYQQAIEVYQEAGDTLSATGALADLASTEIELGRYDQATEHLRRALPVFRAAKDHIQEATVLSWLGELSLRQGELAQASASFEQALAICRRIDYRIGIAAQFTNLGDVSVRQGQPAQAIGFLRQALALHREAGYLYGEIEALRSLAQALQAANKPSAARAELQTALRLAAETGNTYQLASAHRDLAESHHSGGEDEQARHHWQAALELYTELGAAEAGPVRSRLSVLRADR
jgi:tetratricopeptide (TPR) repeat protein/transcriptional regulator with XRE-family HTH domain